MSRDSHVRALQRRWQQTGDVADERRLVLARVRSGELDPSALALIEPVWAGEVERKTLDLLAYAGDAQATALVDVGPLVELACYLTDLGAVNVILDDDPTWAELYAWLGGLEHWGADAARGVLVGILADECSRAQAYLAHLRALHQAAGGDPYGELWAQQHDLDSDLRQAMEIEPELGEFLEGREVAPSDQRVDPSLRYMADDLWDSAGWLTRHASRFGVDWASQASGRAPEVLRTVRRFLRFRCWPAAASDERRQGRVKA